MFAQKNQKNHIKLKKIHWFYKKQKTDFFFFFWKFSKIFWKFEVKKAKIEDRKREGVKFLRLTHNLCVKTCV